MKRIFLLFTTFGYCTHAFALLNRKPLSSHRTNPCFAGYEIDTQDNASDVDNTDVDNNNSIVNKPRVEFAAISPGNQVEVQIGNIELARKAWKKRRRSGSPLLIPCSILNTDRRSMVTNNIIYLLQKFGKPLSDQKNMLERPFGFKSKDISLCMPDLHRYYKSKMRSSLHNHVAMLGYESSTDFLEDVFDEELKREFGIEFYLTDDNLQWLVSSMSKMRGQRLASQSAILQFLKNDHDNTMKHTGMMSVVKADAEQKSYEINPLSAALRVSQRTIDAGIISNGSRHHSLVVSLDPMGDGGCPLLKVSLDTPGQGKKPRKNRRILSESKFELKKIEHEFQKLKVGDGPFIGRVIQLNKKSKIAYVDIGVGRSAKRDTDKKVIVRELGVLHLNAYTMEYKDRLEKWKDDTLKNEMLSSIKYDNDEDTNIKITGNYDNPIDFSRLNVDNLFDSTKSSDDDMDSNIDVGINNDHLSNRLTPEEQSERLEENYSNDASLRKKSFTKCDYFVNEGDEVEVYIQATSKQSGNFMVTRNAVVPVLKQVKKEEKVNKNLERLLARFDGEIKNILKWKGTVGKGTVKATSKTGDWFYVEPHFHDLPVGVAQLGDGRISIDSLSQGDSVKVRLDGIDRSRGQLSLTIVDKA